FPPPVVVHRALAPGVAQRPGPREPEDEIARPARSSRAEVYGDRATGPRNHLPRPATRPCGVPCRLDGLRRVPECEEPRSHRRIHLVKFSGAAPGPPPPQSAQWDCRSVDREADSILEHREAEGTHRPLFGRERVSWPVDNRQYGGPDASPGSPGRDS